MPISLGYEVCENFKIYFVSFEDARQTWRLKFLEKEFDKYLSKIDIVSLEGSELEDLKMNLQTKMIKCSCMQTTPPDSPRMNDLVVENIKNSTDKRTTFMIRNIPNKYSQQMLLDFVNESHKGKFDFFYLRMDFKNKCNVGYAFINFPDPKYKWTNGRDVLTLRDRIEGKKWQKFNSDKVGAISYARIQGKSNLVEKFRNST